MSGWKKPFPEIPAGGQRGLERMPKCILIAGPNGAGKTTFARQFLPREARIAHFINADLIASGLSPLHPESANRAAGRLFLKELDRLAAQRVDFAFETTLSGLSHANRIAAWKATGYRIEIIYLRLESPRLALRRIAARIRQGGHSIPAADVLRRFDRSWVNFCESYRPLADAWVVYDNSTAAPQLIDSSK